MAALHAGGWVMTQKSEARAAIARCPGFPSWGGDLLSRFRSTIGAAWLNFSVRDGKRWIPRAIAALILFLFPAGGLLAAAVVPRKGTDHGAHASSQGSAPRRTEQPHLSVSRGLQAAMPSQESSREISTARL